MMQKKTLCFKEYMLAGIFFLAIVFGVLFFYGTINSGIHLVDDHEFYDIQDSLNNTGFLDTVGKTIANDFRWRFRPLYWIFRIIGIDLFGTNTFAWSVCKGIEISLAMLLFYIFARLMNTSRLFSILFPILILVGEQSAIWWRLGPQESIGIMLFGGAMLATYYLSRHRNVFSCVLFIFVLTALSLQKEAFCISMPGFFILLLALNCYHNKAEISAKSWRQTLSDFLKQYCPEIILMSIIFLVEVYIIIFIVGVDSVSYAGFHDMSILDYIISILVNLKHWCLPYLFLMVGTAALMQIVIRTSDISKVEICELVFIMYTFITQQLCHAKSQMWERYLIPWVICICYFTIINGYRIIQRNKRVMTAMAVLLFSFTIFFADKVFSAARDFTRNSQDLWDCIDYIVTTAPPQNNPRFVSVMRDKEPDGSICTVLSHEYNYTNCCTIDFYEDDLSQITDADILFGKIGQPHARITEAQGSINEWNIYESKHYFYEVWVKKKSAD